MITLSSALCPSMLYFGRMNARYDVAVVGGGPAGLSAALVLARCCRRVIVCDEGYPRNRRAQAVHNFLTRDGISPADLRERSLAELANHGATVRTARVERAACSSASGEPTLFDLALSTGELFQSRKVLLATGVRDILPAISGIDQYYGLGVRHCPDCDAYDYRDKRLVSLGSGNAAAGLALALRTWSKSVVACSHGVPVDDAHAARLARNAIALHQEPVRRLTGRAGRLAAVELEGGLEIGCDGLFFNTDQVQRSPLPAMLGCRYREPAQIETTERQRTDVPGVFLAGDADGDVQFVIVAAAEGATAAVAINRELQEEDFA